jgi:hypothetical protein
MDAYLAAYPGGEVVTCAVVGVVAPAELLRVTRAVLRS